MTLRSCESVLCSEATESARLGAGEASALARSDSPLLVGRDSLALMVVGLVVVVIVVVDNESARVSRDGRERKECVGRCRSVTSARGCYNAKKVGGILFFAIAVAREKRFSSSARPASLPAWYSHTMPSWDEGTSASRPFLSFLLPVAVSMGLLVVVASTLVLLLVVQELLRLFVLGGLLLLLLRLSSSCRWIVRCRCFDERT